MPQFVERQNKNRATGDKSAKNNNHIPFSPNPRLSGDFLLGRNGLGLSYTRKQALKRYHVLVRSGYKPKIVLDSFSKQTFPNTYQSIVYHLKKHGKGMTAGQYAESALAYFIENYYRAQLKHDRMGKRSWNIRGKIGGWWTAAGRIITYWF